MARQLQNGIFGPQNHHPKVEAEAPVSKELDNMPMHRWTEELSASLSSQETNSSVSANGEITKIKLELIALRRYVQEIEAKQARTETKHQETLEICKKMVEKTILLAKGSEEKLKSVTQGVLVELSSIKGKLREHKVTETKVEEMILRHNRVVQMFEHRMDEVQKFIREQEMKMATYRSLLNEVQNKLNSPLNKRT